ncbi:chromate transporter [Allobaculum mucilyticum]|uniref:chromate transporter n=1 Tax=Allobaculum mucilyticum TaxID=2834459 RepID=UPI001E58E5D6|nr:chromate transporter [Allobaculum mucilyticum]UNT96875.1 chromate transporter [Allobaculum mucilyticum]
MNIYLDLFTTFAKIGLFTFGGGLAMLPMLEKEVVDHKKWATNDELIDYFAIGQCTPGIIAVNTATFIGYSQKKVPGAIVATLGVIFPSIVIILLIASLMTTFAQEPIVQHALAGIRIAVCVLIVKALISMFRSGIKDYWGVGLFVLFAVCSYFGILSATVIVILAAVAGIVIKSCFADSKTKDTITTHPSVKTSPSSDTAQSADSSNSVSVKADLPGNSAPAADVTGHAAGHTEESKSLKENDENKEQKGENAQ